MKHTEKLNAILRELYARGSDKMDQMLKTKHAHLIICSEKDNLSAILRDLKRHMSKTILKAIEENGQ